MTKKKNDDIFLDDEVYEFEAEEEKGKLIGDFFCRITSAEINPAYVSKAGKKQMSVALIFKIVPHIDDRGWAGKEVKVFLYGNAQWKMDSVFKAIDLPYIPHETNTYKNGEPVKKWQLSQKNLIGRGCTINMIKPEGKKYSEPDEFTIIDNLKVLSQDELMTMFPVDPDTDTSGLDTNVPF